MACTSVSQHLWAVCEQSPSISHSLIGLAGYFSTGTSQKFGQYPSLLIPGTGLTHINPPQSTGQHLCPASWQWLSCVQKLVSQRLSSGSLGQNPGLSTFGPYSVKVCGEPNWAATKPKRLKRQSAIGAPLIFNFGCTRIRFFPKFLFRAINVFKQIETTQL